jgi:hypothetical protein
VTPKSFVCKSESNRTVFKVENYAPGLEDEDVWDFGPGPRSGADYSPTNHCTYSYHNPYNRFFLSTASSEPGMAVAADQNPWLDIDAAADVGNFTWDSHEKVDGMPRYQYGNARPHQREGQNVLFMDNHVGFEKQCFCGIEEDNIYTYQVTGVEIQQGAGPDCNIDKANFCKAFPDRPKDSLLLNECGLGSTPEPNPDRPQMGGHP